jgi:hypothetical protein
MYNPNYHMSYFHCDPFTNLPHINIPTSNITPNPSVYSMPYQSFYQPVQQPVYQPIQQPVYQPVHQPVQQPVYQPVQEPVYPPIEQPVRILVRRNIPVPVVFATEQVEQPGFFDFTDYNECELENTSGLTNKSKKRKSSKK